MATVSGCTLTIQNADAFQPKLFCFFVVVSICIIWLSQAHFECLLVLVLDLFTEECCKHYCVNKRELFCELLAPMHMQLLYCTLDVFTSTDVEQLYH